MLENRSVAEATIGEPRSQDPQSLGFGRAALDLKRLRSLTERPPLFAPHEVPFWDDPYIATQMLTAHLDPELNAASRPHAMIDQEVAWIVSELGLESGQRLLDLGCGPGLYCTRFAEQKLRVTGIDLSPTSLDYAKRDAEQRGLAIEYICQDYRLLDRVGEFDAACLIFLDFGVLSDRDRDDVLARVYLALKPGGFFVFDVTTPLGAIHHEGAQRWSVHDSGFWRPGPYLELTQEFAYPEANVTVRQTVIVDEAGTVRVYRIWNQSYSVERITTVLEAQGFHVGSVWSDLLGTPFRDDSQILGVVARKP